MNNQLSVEPMLINEEDSFSTAPIDDIFTNNTGASVDVDILTDVNFFESHTMQALNTNDPLLFNNDIEIESNKEYAISDFDPPPPLASETTMSTNEEIENTYGIFTVRREDTGELILPDSTTLVQTTQHSQQTTTLIEEEGFHSYITQYDNTTVGSDPSEEQFYSKNYLNNEATPKENTPWIENFEYQEDSSQDTVPNLLKQENISEEGDVFSQNTEDTLIFSSNQSSFEQEPVLSFIEEVQLANKRATQRDEQEQEYSALKKEKQLEEKDFHALLAEYSHDIRSENTISDSTQVFTHDIDYTIDMGYDTDMLAIENQFTILASST